MQLRRRQDGAVRLHVSTPGPSPQKPSVKRQSTAEHAQSVQCRRPSAGRPSPPPHRHHHASPARPSSGTTSMREEAPRRRALPQQEKPLLLYGVNTCSSCTSKQHMSGACVSASGSSRSSPRRLSTPQPSPSRLLELKRMPHSVRATRKQPARPRPVEEAPEILDLTGGSLEEPLRAHPLAWSTPTGKYGHRGGTNQTGASRAAESVLRDCPRAGALCPPPGADLVLSQPLRAHSDVASEDRSRADFPVGSWVDMPAFLAGRSWREALAGGEGRVDSVPLLPSCSEPARFSRPRPM